jgi:hypothetical protein
MMRRDAALRVMRDHRDMGQRHRCRRALHFVRQAAAEWPCRLSQRQPVRRMLERGDIRQPRRCPTQAGALELRPLHRRAAVLSGKSVPPQERADHMRKLMVPRPARLPNPKSTSINPRDSCHERGATRRRPGSILPCYRLRLGWCPFSQLRK